MTFNDPRLNRRSLLAVATTLAASPLLTTQAGAQCTTVHFQVATPEQEAGTDTGTPVATEAGPVIPPEYENQADTDWLTENRTLQMDRNVPGSDISSETVSTLGEAWTFEVPGDGAYGVLTSNPIIHGENSSS